ncbi:MAG: hypothetical protein M3Q56_11265 [Bacteroidota bacterium]|nr:hypothetical protein [Bacteroidota bacterium]
MHKLLYLLVCFSIVEPALCQHFVGEYTGTITNNEKVYLALSQNGHQFSGILKDEHFSYEVSARMIEKSLQGIATNTEHGLVLNLIANISNNGLNAVLEIGGVQLNIDFARIIDQKPTEKIGQKSIQNSSAIKFPPQAQHDPNIVGKWTRQSNYNSGYGAEGSMSTEESTIFHPDGSLSDGGSRTVTGGSNWTGTTESNASGIFHGIKWYSVGNQLYFISNENNKLSTELLGRYYIEDGKMLITSIDGTKALFYKN